MVKRCTVVNADYSFTDNLHILSTSVGGRIYFIFTVLPCGPCKSRCTSSAFMPDVFSVSTFVMKSPFLSIPDECALPSPGVRACQRNDIRVRRAGDSVRGKKIGNITRKILYYYSILLVHDLIHQCRSCFARMVIVLCHLQLQK